MLTDMQFCPLCERVLERQMFRQGGQVCRACGDNRGGARAGTSRVAKLDEQLASQVISLRRLGYHGSRICDALRLERQSERNAVMELLARPGLRRYQRGPEVGGPVFRRSGRYWS